METIFIKNFFMTLRRVIKKYIHRDKNLDICQMEVAWIVIAVAIVVFLILMCSSKKEEYGGPVKRIQRIPKNACYGICGQHFNRCTAEFSHINADWCSKKYYACRNVCNYSDYQRL